jgi:hypothetical protein
MNALFNDERFKDITFRCNDGELRAHKCVLAASSNEYFRAMFSGNLPVEDVIDIDVSKDIFTIILDDLYDPIDDLKVETNAFEREPGFVEQLLLAADRFRCPNLIKTICANLDLVSAKTIAHIFLQYPDLRKSVVSPEAMAAIAMDSRFSDEDIYNIIKLQSWIKGEVAELMIKSDLPFTRFKYLYQNFYPIDHMDYLRFAQCGKLSWEFVAKSFYLAQHDISYHVISEHVTDFPFAPEIYVVSKTVRSGQFHKHLTCASVQYDKVYDRTSDKFLNMQPEDVKEDPSHNGYQIIGLFAL